MDQFNRQWIIEKSLIIIAQYSKGMLTLRSLYYRLVADYGLTNSILHYKRVVKAMTAARWDGTVDFDTFSDLGRTMVGRTDCEESDVDSSIVQAKEAIELWTQTYYKNRWENQPIYPEVLIEKQALQNVFERPCSGLGVALGACKGYPSLTFLNELAGRLNKQSREGKSPVILYFGDYDPSGEDIPRSIADNLERLGCHDVEVRRILLLKEHVIEWDLPPAPAKTTDSRTKNWDGLGQVELDAVEPRRLQRICREAINSVFDEDLYEELEKQEEEEQEMYREEMREFINNLEI